MLHKIVYNLGMKYRNPSLLPYLKFLKDSDKWSLEQLQEYQFKKAKEFLCFTGEHSVFYKEYFARYNFVPSKMTSLKDLDVLPPITKDVLIARNADIHTDYKFSKLIFCETSGTSGQVLSYHKDEVWDSHNRAAMFRGYSWYGVEPYERNGYFWGYNKSMNFKGTVLDMLQNRFRVFSYNEDEIEKFAMKLKSASFLEGYSSMIYEVAKIINRLGLSQKFNLKMIKGTSEMIYDYYQEEVQKAFGKKIISEYGASESGLIAYECPEGGHMHINMENCIVEVENGEIIVTNLLSRSFPIIRYKLGDSVTLAPEGFKCSCGRSHPVILDVLGRVGKNIHGKKNHYPSLTFYYVFKNLALTKGVNLNYQAVQDKPGEVTIKIEQIHPELASDIKVEMEKYFKDDLDYQLLWGTKLHSMNGKLKDFITTLE